VIEVFVEAGETVPSPFTAMLLVNWGGAVAQVDADDTVVSGRGSPFNLHLNGMWQDPEATDENIAWVRGVSSALAPHVVPGISLNFLIEVGDAECKRASARPRSSACARSSNATTLTTSSG
jgi:hypothetical protein